MREGFVCGDPDGEGGTSVHGVFEMLVASRPKAERARMEKRHSHEHLRDLHPALHPHPHPHPHPHELLREPRDGVFERVINPRDGVFERVINPRDGVFEAPRRPMGKPTLAPSTSSGMPPPLSAIR